MKTKKKNILSAVRLWAISQSMDEITDNETCANYTDIAFKKGEKIIGFITEFDNSNYQIAVKMVNLKDSCNYIYIVTDDISKKQQIENRIPSYCGILCYSNPYGLGYGYQVLREPELN